MRIITDFNHMIVAVFNIYNNNNLQRYRPCTPWSMYYVTTCNNSYWRSYKLNNIHCHNYARSDLYRKPSWPRGVFSFSQRFGGRQWNAVESDSCRQIRWQVRYVHGGRVRASGTLTYASLYLSHTYQPAMKKKRDKIIEKVGFLAEKRDIPENLIKLPSSKAK